MIICILISLLSLEIWSSSVFVVWVVWVFWISGLVPGMRVMLSICVVIIISITTISLCSWTFISVMSFTSLKCFFLSFNVFFCQTATASIFALFLVVCLTHSSSSFFFTTSETDLLSIKVVNSWSISSSFFLKYSLFAVYSVSIFSIDLSKCCNSKSLLSNCLLSQF